MSLKYEQITDAVSTVYYNDEKKLSYGALYKKVVGIIRSKISNTYLLDVLDQMIRLGELEKRIDSNSKIKLSPTYYSLSVNSKKLKNLNIFGHPKTDLYKRIIREIILYEISGRGLVRIPIEIDLKTVLSNLTINSELIRIHSGLKIRFYYPPYPTREGNIVMTSFGFDTFEHIYSLKSNNDIRIFSVVQRLSGDKRPIKIFNHFSYVIRGFTVKELMEHINYTEEEYKMDDIVEVLDVLQKNDIVDLITTFNDQHRFGLKEEIYSFIEKYIRLEYEKALLLLYEAVLAQKIPSKKEIEVLSCLLSQKKAKIVLHHVNKAIVDIKRMLKTSTNLEEYNEYLKNGIRIYGMRLNFKSLRSMLDHLLEAYKLKGPKLKRILLKQKVEKYNKEASNELFCYHKLVQKCLGALLISCMRRIDALFARNTHFAYLRSILVP